MKKSEFLRNITTFGELIDLCYTESCYICDEVYDEDSMDDAINSNLAETAREACYWQDLRDYLNNIPSGYEYYSYDGSDWTGLDDSDFRYYKSDVEDWMDHNNAWDDEDEDEEECGEECGEEDDDDESFYDDLEDDTMSDLLLSGVTKLNDIERIKEEERRNIVEFEELCWG